MMEAQSTGAEELGQYTLLGTDHGGIELYLCSSVRCREYALASELGMKVRDAIFVPGRQEHLEHR